MTQPIDGTQSGTDPNAGGTGSNEGIEDGTTGTNPDGSQSGAQQQQTQGRVYTADEYEQLRRRMQAADSNRSKAEQELQQLRDKDMPQLEKLTRDLQTATARAEAAEKRRDEVMLHNAFLQDNTYAWHNATRALGMLDMSKVDIDPESGAVTGLKDAIAALAKSDPYLIKPEADDGEGREKTPVGTVPANNGGTGSGKPNQKQLGARFTAMRGRA